MRVISHVVLRAALKWDDDLHGPLDKRQITYSPIRSLPRLVGDARIFASKADAYASLLKILPGTSNRLVPYSNLPSRFAAQTTADAVSPHPHPVQRRVHLGSPEAHRPADFEIRNQAGHSPAVEVAFAHSEEGAGVLFGE